MTSFLATTIESFGGPLTKSAASALGIPFRAFLRRPDGVQIYLDATVRESHKIGLKTTEHPVEDGSEVSDHAQLMPDELTLEGIISNRPIVVLASLRAEPVIPGGNPKQRAEDAYREFRRLMQTATLLFVSTELRDYTDMLIKDVAVVRDKDTDQILSMTMRLGQFRKSTVESVSAPVPEEPTHAPEKELGSKAKGNAPPEVAEQSNTVFEQVANALGGFSG